MEAHPDQKGEPQNEVLYQRVIVVSRMVSNLVSEAEPVLALPSPSEQAPVEVVIPDTRVRRRDQFDCQVYRKRIVSLMLRHPDTSHMCSNRSRILTSVPKVSISV